LGSTTRWLLGSVALSVAVVCGVRFCGSPRYQQRRAVFPDSVPRATLAIREPLVRPELTVMATLRDSGGRSKPLWMSVDSGATGVTLPEKTYGALGLDPLSGVSIRTVDPSGRVLIRAAGLVPTMLLGALEVSDVVAALGDSGSVLGQSVLAHSPWEIDWDRGVLTLGATPWSEGTDTIVLPLHHEGDGEVVTITIDGKPIDMVLDTGAFASTIPKGVGTSAGLTTTRMRPTLFKSMAGELVVRDLFSGEVRLGPLSVGRVDFAALSSGGRRAAFGLLGLDVLSRYRVQVIPGTQLALRPREGMRRTAAARIARWGFLPLSCAHPGCVHAQIEKDGTRASLRVSFEADVTRPIDVLLGCEDDRGDDEVRTESRLAFAHAPIEPKHVRVHLERGTRGTVSTTKIAYGAAWFQAGGGECRKLVALDVSPTTLELEDASAQGTTDASDELHARLWP